jgi:hypothetical protein
MPTCPLECSAFAGRAGLSEPAADSAEADSLGLAPACFGLTSPSTERIRFKTT